LTLRAQVFTALRWTAGARLMSQVVTWAITLIVIRLLTPADYGLLAMASIALGFVTLIADGGLGPALVQRPTLSEGELRQAFGIVLAVHFALAVALVAAAPMIAHFFDEPRLVLIIRALSLLVVMAAFSVIPESLLERRLEFRNRSLLDLGATITGSLLTLALALAGYGVWALVFGSLTMQALKSAGMNVLARWIGRPEFSLAGARALLTAGGQTSLGRVIWFFFIQADMLIAGRWLGKEALGFYSVAMHLASLPNTRITALINQVAFPAFSRMQADLSWVAAKTLLGVRLLSFLSFPILWGLSSVAPEVVEVVLGPAWANTTLPLQVLGLIMPLRLVSTFVPNAVQGLGRFDVGLRNIIVAFTVMVPAFAIGVQWGLVGLSLAWLFGTPVMFLLNMRQNMAVLKTRLRSLLAAMGRPAMAGVVMYGAIAACRTTVVAEFASPVRLGLLIMVGALAYVTATFAFNRAGLRELLALIRGVARD
jgi:teichuronic acid exporter